MPRFCIVGLGNPGARYTATRHNLGFRVADRLAAEHNTSIRRPEFQALTATLSIGRTEVLLMKPQTYMNLSGASVEAARQALRLSCDRIIVACDDVDLPLGRIRVRAGGAAAGHRGVASIIESLGTDVFSRVRMGVGRPPEGVETADYVLRCFEETEGVAAESTVVRAAAAIETVVDEGLEAAMRVFNASPAAD